MAKTADLHSHDTSFIHSMRHQLRSRTNLLQKKKLEEKKAMEIVKKKVGRKRRLWSSTCRNNRLLTLAALHFAVAVVPATKSVWRSRLAAVREQIDEDLLLMLFETQIDYIDFCIAYNGFNPLPIKSGPYKVIWVEPVNFSG
nr:hypothetical protein Iba_chr01bCG3430 [Ipomoea batatas]GME11131.1 hypothetical protein Iba_scaffold11353CG0010 [Ipomoea batatas]